MSQNLKTLYLKWHVDYVNTVNFVHDQNKRHERNTIMTIKYENLITDVHNNMLNLLKFAGLPDDKINISRVPGTIKNTNAKYLNSDHKHLLKIIENITDGVMERYQYEKMYP